MTIQLLAQTDHNDSDFTPVPCPMANDVTLVAAAQRGNSQAFGVLAERHKRMILATALRMIGNREDAEDVVQQSFQKAFINLHKFEGRSSFSTWLMRIALNEALMLLRTNRRSRELSLDEPRDGGESEFVPKIHDSHPNPEHMYSQQQREQLLFEAMGQLNPRIRKAVQLFGLEEMSLKETAQAMGVSVPAAKSRILRGRKSLREALRRQLSGGQLSRNKTIRGVGRNRAIHVFPSQTDRVDRPRRQAA